MTALGRIVCATDSTARSDLALGRAVLLARQTGARLTLVHAVDPRQSQRQVRAQVNRAYVHLLSKVDQGLGSESAVIDIDIDVRAGGPLDVIAQIASETNADLVVLAAPQRRRLDSIVGTTAERLLRTTGRPVLVVHREARDSYRQVAMAVDLSNVSLPMIQTASRLGVLDNAETTLLHATSAPTKACSRPSAWTSEPSRTTGWDGRRTRGSDCKRYAPLPKWKSRAPDSWSGRKRRRSQFSSCWSGSSRTC